MTVAEIESLHPWDVRSSRAVLNSHADSEPRAGWNSPARQTHTTNGGLQADSPVEPAPQQQNYWLFLFPLDWRTKLINFVLCRKV